MQQTSSPSVAAAVPERLALLLRAGVDADHLARRGHIKTGPGTRLCHPSATHPNTPRQRQNATGEQIAAVDADWCPRCLPMIDTSLERDPYRPLHHAVTFALLADSLDHGVLAATRARLGTGTWTVADIERVQRAAGRGAGLEERNVPWERTRELQAEVIAQLASLGRVVESLTPADAWRRIGAEDTDRYRVVLAWLGPTQAYLAVRLGSDRPTARQRVLTVALFAGRPFTTSVRDGAGAMAAVPVPEGASLPNTITEIPARSPAHAANLADLLAELATGTATLDEALHAARALLA